MALKQAADRAYVSAETSGSSRRWRDCSGGPEVPFFVVDIGDAAAHAGGEVASRAAEHNDGSVGHVFTAVVAYTFDNRGCAGVRTAKRSLRCH